MADIFISYSRNDSEQAERLAERLRAEGMEVWIDRKGIIGAEQWATEIVEGIKACSTFAILLSPRSVASENVLKELSLASEKRKRVLPINLEPTVLPSSFEYALAGLQRVAISNFEGIVHAHRHGVARIAKKDERTSLMILPFEDLSPHGDNGWFADGIASELISALSNVKALRIADQQATKEYKRYTGTLPIYAKEMSIRFFVQGDVRKFGDQIKITSRLLDVETGDYLWQDSMRGEMKDIFDFQEAVAQKVVDGLRLILTSDEKKKLAERGTDNAEAYELYLKAQDYFERITKEGFHIAAQLDSDAIALDPGYAHAYQHKANALAHLYRSYDPNPELLVEAERLCKEALRLKPDLFEVYNPLSVIYLLQGKIAESEQAVLEFIRTAPENSLSHFSLGFFYSSIGESVKAIAPFEESIRLKPDQRSALFNLVLACHGADEISQEGAFAEKRTKHALDALPLFGRHLKLHPDDEGSRQSYAILLFFAGRTENARREAIILKNAKDAVSLYNTACLFGSLGDKQEALETFRMAIELGFNNIRTMRGFLAGEVDGIANLRGTPEYEEVERMVEQIAREEKE